MSSSPNPEEVWMKSTVTEGELEKMVEDQVQPAKELIGWRAANGELFFPTADTEKIVAFTSFFYQGFSLPSSYFFRGLLHFYGIELVNLNPNSILQISAFIHLCEAFLGVRPHFTLFRHLFALKATQKGGQTSVVGGASLQLHSGKSAQYIGLPIKISLKGWHSKWFYISNLRPSLPSYVGRRPIVKESWSSLPEGEELKQVVLLLEKLAAYKSEEGLNGISIVRSF